MFLTHKMAILELTLRRRSETFISFVQAEEVHYTLPLMVDSWVAIYVPQCLQSTKSPREFAEQLVTEAHQYNGFNLIVADICSKTMVYISNRPKGEPITIRDVSPGIHVLSNAKLDSPWHKVKDH